MTEISEELTFDIPIMELWFISMLKLELGNTFSIPPNFEFVKNTYPSFPETEPIIVLILFL